MDESSVNPSKARAEWQTLPVKTKQEFLDEVYAYVCRMCVSDFGMFRGPARFRFLSTKFAARALRHYDTPLDDLLTSDPRLYTCVSARTGGLLVAPKDLILEECDGNANMLCAYVEDRLERMLKK